MVLEGFSLGFAASLAAAVFSDAARLAVQWLTDPQWEALRPVFKRAFAVMLDETAGNLPKKSQKEVGNLWMAFVKQPGVAATLVNLALAKQTGEAEDKQALIDLANTFKGVSEKHQDAPVEVLTSLVSLLCALKDALHEEARTPGSLLHEWITDEKLDDILRSLRKLLEQSPPIPMPHQLAGDLSDFTGRDKEMRKLLAALDGGGGRAAISAIEGMGGVGKTALAVHVGHKLRDAYPDGQIQVDLQGFSDRPPLEPREAMARVIHALDPERRLPEDVLELGGIYRSVLADKRLLLLLDNASDAAQVEPLLTGPPCGFIITSRNTIIVPGVEGVDLSVLSGGEARDLLRLIVGPERATGAELDLLAGICGLLPLALRVAGTFLEVHPDWTPGEYAAALEKEREHVVEKLRIKGHALDVQTVLGFSARRLIEDNPTLAAHWQMLSVFPSTFDRPAAAAVCEVTVDDAHESLSALRARNLVVYDKDADRYRLHDLLRAVARKVFAYQATPETEGVQTQRFEAARARHAEHYARVLSEAKAAFKQGHENVTRGLAAADAEWDNIRAGQMWAANHAEMNDVAAALCNQYPDAGVHVLSLRLHPRERIAWMEAALDAARRLGDREAEGLHLGNLASAYADLGEVRRAIEYNAQALVIARETGNRRVEGQVLGNLGSAYADLGEVRRAIEYYQQDLAIAREIGDRRGEGQTLGNLGIAYGNLGEARRAIEYHEQALVIDRDIGDRRGEGQDLGNLGSACAALGEVWRAIEYHEQALVIDREIGDQRGEGQDLCGLGVAYADLGEVRRAIGYHEQALVINRDIGDRRGEGQNLGNLGNAYADLGEVRRAIEYYQQNLAITREIGDRRGEGNTLWNMSLALYGLGQRDEAVAHAAAALVIFEQIEDPNAEKVRKKLAAWREEPGESGPGT